ncbi:MAG: ABC transporter ATP-binding protein [Kineosporiaceae bacterium]|nr:ABC transporter ATP-binding protein [Kineosporiaceae bacterium]
MSLCELTVRYGGSGGRVAVDRLTLTAERGRVTALLGPNGAGKTSTIECCEGLRRVTSGTVRVLGLDPVSDSRALRSRVGVMLQDGGLPTGARAGEVLRHVAALHEDPEPPAELLTRLGLTEHTRTMVRRLSGGQRQRLSLAVALVGRPELVFLDEPSSGLDPQARRAVWDIVTELRSRGVTVILTTHLMDEAETLADHVVVIDHGHLVAEGSPAELTGGTADALTFGAPSGLDLLELAGALPAGATVAETTPGHYKVSGRPDTPLDPATVAAVTGWCAAQGILPEGLTLGRRSLEDVFLHLTGRQVR